MNELNPELYAVLLRCCLGLCRGRQADAEDFPHDTIIDAVTITSARQVLAWAVRPADGDNTDQCCAEDRAVNGADGDRLRRHAERLVACSLAIARLRPGCPDLSELAARVRGDLAPLTRREGFARRLVLHHLAPALQFLPDPARVETIHFALVEGLAPRIYALTLCQWPLDSGPRGLYEDPRCGALPLPSDFARGLGDAYAGVGGGLDGPVSWRLQALAPSFTPCGAVPDRSFQLAAWVLVQALAEGRSVGADCLVSGEVDVRSAPGLPPALLPAGAGEARARLGCASGFKLIVSAGTERSMVRAWPGVYLAGTVAEACELAFSPRRPAPPLAPVPYRDCDSPSFDSDPADRGALLEHPPSALPLDRVFPFPLRSRGPLPAPPPWPERRPAGPPGDPPGRDYSPRPVDRCPIPTEIKSPAESSPVFPPRLDRPPVSLVRGPGGVRAPGSAQSPASLAPAHGVLAVPAPSPPGGSRVYAVLGRLWGGVVRGLGSLLRPRRAIDRVPPVWVSFDFASVPLVFDKTVAGEYNSGVVPLPPALVYRVVDGHPWSFQLVSSFPAPPDQPPGPVAPLAPS